MNTKFTVEESNLISIFEDKSREKVIQNIHAAVPHLEDAELLELSGQVLEKLKNMSEEEFVQLEFVAVE